MKRLFAVIGLIAALIVPKEAAGTENIAAVKRSLPRDAELIKPNQPPYASSIETYDFDLDGVDELIAIFRKKGEKKKIHLVMLKKEKDQWIIAFEHVDRGYDIEYAGLTDLDGNGTSEFLLSRKTGAFGGDKLEVYGWKDGTLSRLGMPLKHHLMELIEYEDKKGIAIWERYTGDAFLVKAFSLDAGVLAEDARLLTSYLPKVEDYYFGKLREKNSWSYWYALADVQLRAGKLHDAEQSIERGEALGLGLKQFQQLRHRLKIMK